MDSVKLIAITKPIEDISIEEFLAYVARVSNPKNQDNHLTANKLIKYLIKHKHWSPLEMVHMVIEINCTRAIGRQILRHKSFSFQEFSQRYAEINRNMFTTVDCRMQDPANRQNSIKLNSEEYGTDTFISDVWDDIQNHHVDLAIADYEQAINLGIAKEQARVILPEGLTMSRMYMAGSLRSWVHYCQLRMANGTQHEHQQIAKKCWSIITNNFPVLQDVLSDATYEIVN